MRVRSNNPDILYNPRIWHNVKSIELERTYDYDRNFVKELKIKMPKLSLIKFGNRKIFPERYSSEIEDRKEKIDLRLDNVTTIQFTRGLIDGESYRIISSLPNLRHLIFCCGILDSDNELSPILNEKIQRLDIDILSPLKHLTEKSYVYFSNIQYINFCLSHFKEEPEWYADVIMKILRNFKNLKSLFIYIRRRIDVYVNCSREAKLSKLIEYLDMNAIRKNYKMKNFCGYCLFLKRE
jgi:hypothetical protein